MRNFARKVSGSMLVATLGFTGMNLSASDMASGVSEDKNFITAMADEEKVYMSAKDSVIADFDELVKMIEDTHPDPYVNFGGRVFFHKKANDIRRELLNDSNVTVANLYWKASEFISQIQDGHSFVNVPIGGSNEAGSDSLVVVKFMCGDGSLIVNAIDSARGDLIGSRLIGINEVPIEGVFDRVAISYPCENRYGRMGVLCNWFRPVSFYRNILANSFSDSHSGLNTSIPGDTDAVSKSDLIMDFLTSDGDTVRYAPEKVQYNQFGEIAKARAPRDERFPTQQMEWKEVDGSMFFRLASVMARENFEFQYNNGWDFYDQLAYQYRLDGKEMPGDTVAAIQGLPSMSENFLAMLNEMKVNEIKNLVIDLRGNGGGWTPIVLPTLYMMFGDRYLETDMDAKFYRRLSDLYLKKCNTDIAAFNADNGLQLKVGDYMMPEDVTDTRPIEKKREDFLKGAFCSDSIKALLADRGGMPMYTPEKIYVVTDEGTFSAAFHYAFYLSKMGAEITGETSSQAPNCYMEVTPFTLPLTGLSGSISNAMQIFLPRDDPRAKEFTPDITITYDDYSHYGFDGNSILIYLLDSLRH